MISGIFFKLVHGRAGYRRPILPAMATACVLLCISVIPDRSYGQTGFPFAAEPLSEQGDLSAKMVQGINDFLIAETDRRREKRPAQWQRDFSSPQAFDQSIAGQRALLAQRAGVVESRVDPQLKLLSNTALQPLVAQSPKAEVRAVRWQAIDGLSAEGLLLRPKSKVTGRMVMLPDADTQPEVLAGLQQPGAPGFGAALQLAEAGIEVLVPVLLSRGNTYSKSYTIKASTKQPHREWIYRQAYELGRHVIGYELQKVFAAIDWLQARNEAEKNSSGIGVAGHGEGGLLALYAAALDTRIASTLVSGYFDAREQLWKEPIYRNISGLLNVFGDAELAVMAWPRTVVIEAAKGPELVQGGSGAAPGELHTPSAASVQREFSRAKAMLPNNGASLQLIQDNSGAPLQPFTAAALAAFTKGMKSSLPGRLATRTTVVPVSGQWVDTARRQERMVREMGDHVQQVLILCERTRNEKFWKEIKGDVAAQEPVKAAKRQALWEVLGHLPTPSGPMHPRARKFEETDKWAAYEVTLDVFGSQVYAWGIIVIPKNIPPGKKLPAVVCQHGLEGVPAHLLDTTKGSEGNNYYHGLARKLAERGYITFSPHNPYRGQDKFRVIQRKGNPLGITLFGVIISQHQRILEWLGQLPFVDPARIGFYGLSYGGKTAMRVPAVLEGYALSICSADFNEWVRKVSTTNHNFGYVFTGEYDMPEWDLGHTFNYAEMAALIAPRPFMVERGFFDGVGTDEWVNYEYAKVRRHYYLLGLHDRVDIEHFVGPHSIHGVGTFEFLDRHLKK